MVAGRPRGVGALARRVRAARSRDGASAALRLVCPLDELSGCTSSMGERWAGILAKVEFALQPMEQIASEGRFVVEVVGSSDP